jgi:hypothetical protein
MHDGELTEVLVERDQDSLLSVGTRKDLVVAQIARPVSGPNDVMARSFQFRSSLAPYAGVEQ